MIDITIRAALLCADHLGKKVGIRTKDGAEVRDVLTAVSSSLPIRPNGEPLNDGSGTVVWVQFKTIGPKSPSPSGLIYREATFELDLDAFCIVSYEEETHD